MQKEVLPSKALPKLYVISMNYNSAVLVSMPVGEVLNMCEMLAMRYF